MAFFSRTSDIIRCSLSELLETAADPAAALPEILKEMEKGLAGVQRSVGNAAANVDRLARDLAGYGGEICRCTTQARIELSAGRESQARDALAQKRELEDLVAGLEQEHCSAIATRDQLLTTQRAIEARIAEAKRRLESLRTGEKPATATPARLADASPWMKDRAGQIEQELEALRQELRQGAR